MHILEQKKYLNAISASCLCQFAFLGEFWPVEGNFVLVSKPASVHGHSHHDGCQALCAAVHIYCMARWIFRLFNYIYIANLNKWSVFLWERFLSCNFLSHICITKWICIKLGGLVSFSPQVNHLQQGGGVTILGFFFSSWYFAAMYPIGNME